VSSGVFVFLGLDGYHWRASSPTFAKSSTK
jgi:hypothetical protein